MKYPLLLNQLADVLFGFGREDHDGSNHLAGLGVICQKGASKLKGAILLHRAGAGQVGLTHSKTTLLGIGIGMVVSNDDELLLFVQYSCDFNPSQKEGRVEGQIDGRMSEMNLYGDLWW